MLAGHCSLINDCRLTGEVVEFGGKNAKFRPVAPIGLLNARYWAPCVRVVAAQIGRGPLGARDEAIGSIWTGLQAAGGSATAAA